MKPPKYHRMFGYNLDLLPNVHLAELERCATNIKEARALTGATIGYPGWGVIYYILLSHLDRAREEILLETGTNWGCTTIILAQALKDAKCKGKVITIELEPENIARAKENFKAANLTDTIDIRQGRSQDELAKIVKQHSNIRFAFLDASHLFDDVMDEFETILPALTDDAIVLFDNTYQIAENHEDQRVNGALQHIQKKHGGNLINMEFVSWFTPGLAIWQKALNL